MRTLCFLCAIVVLFTSVVADAAPETVYGIAHVRKGSEEQFRLLEKESWDIYVRLELVKPSLHVVLQGLEDGDKPFFLVVFTWKDSEVPDHAPKEVQDLWAKMRELCEKRHGEPAISITEMQIIEPRN